MSGDESGGATHVAFASTRVMATCSLMGQAIGTAGALCRSTDEIHNSPAVRRIQQALLRDDAFLPGIRNEDELDLGRAAACAASSSATTPKAVVDVLPATFIRNGAIGRTTRLTAGNRASSLSGSN